MTPVKAKTAIGSMATVLAFMPNCLPKTQRSMVMANVTPTTTVRQLRCMSPSIFSSMVFCLNGNNFFNTNHAIMRSKITRGAITSIHCPKPMSMLRPAGSLSTLYANALGGVPIGVPIPPRFAPIGMAIVSAIRPLPLAGKALNTGVRNVNIMAAVAVFDMNMENIPVMSMKPSNTFSLFLPKGLIMFFAIHTSRPDFVEAIARMKPPRKSMIVGSAKQAMMPTESSSCPYSPSLPCMKENDELLTKNSSTKIMVTDVAHAGMASVIHSMTAIMKMAMTRC